ncbi:MAG: hypothetical protein OXB88_05760, partial [Bacteriovoracales bacterium]|nr:hypothetical protein [Bacteriovoracales bacterium]
FDIYRTIFSESHESGAGELFQMEAVKSKIKISRLEKLKPNIFGLFGFDLEHLSSTESFPLLNKIDSKTAEKAVLESLSRTKTQARDVFLGKKKKEEDDQRYLKGLRYIKNYPNPSQKGILNLEKSYKKKRIKDLESLATIHHGILGDILLKSPENANHLCLVAQNLATKKRNRALGEGAVYVGVSATLVAASLLSMGGVLPVKAILYSAALGLVFSAGDYVFQKTESRERQKTHEQLLNAYLSATGNERSIDRIRDEWREIQEVNYGANVSLLLALGDIAVIPAAIKVGHFQRNIRKIAKFKNQSKKSDVRFNRYIRQIANDKESLDSINALFDFYPQENIGRLLSVMSELPNKKQVLAMNLINDFSTHKKIYTSGIEKLLKSMKNQGIFDAHRADFAKLMDQNSIENAKIIQRRKDRFLQDERYRNIIQRYSGKRQNQVVLSITYLIKQGKKHDEIARGVANILPVPDSLPNLN